MILILLFILIKFTAGLTLDIYKPSILTFNYENINSYPVSIYLNNARYRESSLLPHNKGLFSIGVKTGKFLISSDNTKFKLIIDEAKLLKSKSKLNNILLKESKWTKLETIEYYHPTEHNLKISTMVNLIKYNYKGGAYIIDLYLDNQLIYTSLLSTNVYTYLSDYMQVNKGKHLIKLIGTSLNNTWCSCMTMNDGFNYGRHLTAWIENNNTKNNSIITTKIIENNYINHKLEPQLNLHLSEKIVNIDFIETKVTKLISKFIF